MKKGLIFNNTLMDVVEVAFEVHSSMKWIDVPDDCTSEWTYANGTVSYVEPEDTRTYADLRKHEYSKLNQFEMQFNDDRDGTTTWVDKINEIKERYPK